MRFRTLGGSSAFVLALSLSGAAHAAPTLRTQVDLNGDFTLIGNTLGLECAAGTPAPIVGTSKCNATLLDGLLSNNGYAYTNQGDTAPDLFWGFVDGGARADKNVAEGEARSTSVLDLPPGATIKLARLYWAAGVGTGTAADKVVTLTVPNGGGAKTITALDADTKTAAPGGGSDTIWYQSSADVTAEVVAAGKGAYTISGVDTRNMRGRDDETLFAGWSMVVFWEAPSQPKRNLALFDGFDVVTPGAAGAAEADLSGFQVPKLGFDAKLGVVAYEGDNQIAGDSFSVNGTTITNATNPGNNFFNGTRTLLGTGDNRAGDLPQLTGGPQSMGGLDLDVVDITARVKPSDTKATFRASTTQDRFVLGAFVTSIATYEADFTNSASKTAVDKNGGALQQGDLITYTLTFKNVGNDTATGSVITDVLDPRITLVGDITVTDKNGTATLTSVDDTDAAEYADGTRTLTVRVGDGANKNAGGSIKVGETVTVVFDVKLNDGATGTVPNQAKLTASSPSGQGSADFDTDGDPTAPGNQGTPISIGECAPGIVCSGATPVCDGATKTCVGCLAATDCPAATPICDASTKACVGCGANTDCPANAPICDVAGTKTCVGCSTGTDCPASAPICDATSKTCVGCSASTDCPASNPICDVAGTKTCVGCVSNTDCTTPSAPVCSSSTRACVGCLADADCSGATPKCNATTGTCQGCVTAADCTDGKSCDATTGACTDSKDTDGDGLLDDFEDKIGTNKNDADSDDDGVIDGNEVDPGGDVDGDKIINALDNDADNDGLQDGTEAGTDCSAIGTDKAKCIPDADGGATKTSPGVADTDGGGVSDGDEDTNKNGRVDAAERDPLNPADDKGGGGGAGGSNGGSAGSAGAGATAGSSGAGATAGSAGAGATAGSAGAAAGSAGAGATAGSAGAGAKAGSAGAGATAGSAGSSAGGTNGAGASGGSNGGTTGAAAAGGATSTGNDPLYGQELEGGCSTTASGQANPASTGFLMGLVGLLAARLRRRPRG